MPGYDKGWALWFVGLPGCGKTTLARGVYDHLADLGYDVIHLQMDIQRKKYFPNPTYTAEERERAYTLFVDEAAEHVRKGKNVLMDGSAYKLSMRTYARQRIPRFAEIFLRCDLDQAMERESLRPEGMVMAELYRKALERLHTGREFEGLGEVIGVDVEFEIDPDAELTIDSSSLTSDETLGKALHFLDSWLPRV